VALARAVVETGGRVFAVSHRRLLRGVPPGSSAISPLALDRLPPTTIHVSSSGIDGFFAGELDLTLRTNRISQLIVAGLGLEGPVHSTLRSANDRGFEGVVVTDACAPADPDLVAGSLSSICMSGGIFGAVVGLRAVLKVLAPAAPPPLVPLTQESPP